MNYCQCCTKQITGFSVEYVLPSGLITEVCGKCFDTDINLHLDITLQLIERAKIRKGGK